MEKSYLKREKNSKENYKKNVKGPNPKETETCYKRENSNNKYLYYSNTKRIVVQLLGFCLNFDFFILHHADTGKLPKYFKNYFNLFRKTEK